MKLVDLEQQIFVPITDESRGGVTYEMGMSLGEFLDGICEGFKPEVVEAMPIAWMNDTVKRYENTGFLQSANSIKMLINDWHEEQGEMT